MQVVTFSVLPVQVRTMAALGSQLAVMLRQ
jgi:hypothetical protein